MTNPYKVKIGGVLADPYRICLAYKVTHPSQQHVIKKLLRAGKSHKSLRQDITESRNSLNRMLDMMDEDERATKRIEAKKLKKKTT